MFVCGSYLSLLDEILNEFKKIVLDSNCNMFDLLSKHRIHSNRQLKNLQPLNIVPYLFRLFIQFQL